METELKKITAVILAGGFGSRLRSVVVNDRPKVLAEVAGRPFLGYLLDQLNTLGISHAVLCTGHLGAQIQSAFGACFRGLRLTYSQETVPLGTAGALRLALSLAEADPVLVLNGDSFFDGDLSSFWSWHEKKNAAASILLVKVSNSKDYGQVCLDDDDCIQSFQEKNQNQSSLWVNSGVYFINRRLLSEIIPHQKLSLEKEIFPSWVGKRFFGYRAKGRFFDIGTPESYQEACHTMGKQLNV
jgi:NDP-sugar pyrophosphorylase family protein